MKAARCRASKTASASELLFVLHAAKMSFYEQYWVKDSGYGKKSAFNRWAKEVDDNAISRPLYSGPEQIDFTRYVPGPVTLSPAQRAEFSAYLRGQLGEDGLTRILGERARTGDLTEDGEVIVQDPNVSMARLLRPLGERTVLQQYERDWERPVYSGILGEAVPVDKSQRIQQAGVFGESFANTETTIEQASGLSFLQDQSPQYYELDYGDGVRYRVPVTPTELQPSPPMDHTSMLDRPYMDPMEYAQHYKHLLESART